MAFLSNLPRDLAIGTPQKKWVGFKTRKTRAFERMALESVAKQHMCFFVFAEERLEGPIN